MNGQVKTIPEGKNFGFIRGEDGKEYFFHSSDFNGFWVDLIEDFLEKKKIEVTFNVVESTKGGRAGNVKRVDFPN